MKTKLPIVNMVLSIFIGLISTAILVFLNIYANVLFLSSYPATWVTYFLILNALSIVPATFLMRYLFEHHIKRNSILIFLFSGGIILALFLLPTLKWFWMAMLVSTLINFIRNFCSYTVSNIFPSIFKLREYKQVITYINQSMNISGTLTNLLVPFLIQLFSVHLLLLLSATFFIMIAASIFFVTMSPFAKIKERKTQVIAKNKNPPLVIYMILFICAMIVVSAFSEYAFKFLLAKDFSKQEIGIFLGYFYAAINFLSFLLGMSITKRFLQIIRLNGLIFATPFFVLISSIFTIVIPGFWSFSLLEGVRRCFSNTYFKICTEITFNVFPTVVRNRANAKRRLLGTCVELITLLSILWLATFLSMRGIAIIIFIISLACLPLVKKITQAYKQTLLEEGEFRRFSLMDEVNPTNIDTFKQIMENSLKSADINNMLFGLNVLSRIAPTVLPTVLYNHLQHPDKLIRAAVINAIKQNKDSKSLPFLLQQFKQEEQIDLRIAILEVIFLLDVKSALPIAQEYIKQPVDQLYPVAIGILIRLGNSADPTSLNIKKLRELLKNPNPLIRKEAALVVGKNKLKEFESEIGLLITDENPDVKDAAIKSASRCQFTPLISHIIFHFDPNVKESRKSIIHFGPLIIPSLLIQIEKNIHNFLYLETLAAIPGKESEQAFLELNNYGDLYFRTQVAKQALNRAFVHDSSDDFKIAAKKNATTEAFNIGFLHELALQVSSTAIKHEIEARATLAKKRALYWIAIAIDPIEISKLIPSLLQEPTTPIYQQAQEKTLELLEIYILDVNLKHLFINIFENEKIIVPSNLEYQEYDSWLSTILQFSKNPSEVKNMEMILKVFDLRSVPLFKDLPAEILLKIAEETEEKTFNEGDVIFKENDIPDGLYCIRSGKVKITRNDNLLNTLTTNDFFGELALIDDAGRAASATAATDCSLLYLDKSTFDRLTNDIPDILRVITKFILGYLRQNLESTK